MDCNRCIYAAAGNTVALLSRCSGCQREMRAINNAAMRTPVVPPARRVTDEDGYIHIVCGDYCFENGCQNACRSTGSVRSHIVRRAS